MKKGDQGPEVERLQQRLQDLGYLQGEPDGAYGPKTEAVVKDFQRDYGLAADGKVGPRTQARLDRARPDDNGRLSRRYEGAGPGTISGGEGDPGGVSYGEYQLASRRGSVDAFVQWLRERHPDWAAEALSVARPGTAKFSAAWSKIAGDRPDDFGDAQTAYATEAYYRPAVKNVKEATGLDAGRRSHALQEVVWSTAIQHGTGGVATLFERALAGKKPSKVKDQQLIEAIYAERGRTDDAGVAVYFRSASKAMQQGVLKRFRNEAQDALAMLRREQAARPPKAVKAVKVVKVVKKKKAAPR